MNTLQLTLPTQLETDVSASKIKPREVVAWLENLPFLDLQRTAPAIHQQLRLFNRRTIPPAQRLEILDAFRTSYSRLRSAKPSAGQPLNFDLQMLCKKQCQDLSFGYKIALNDLLNKKLALVGQKKLLAHAAGGALDCLSHHMTYFFAAYQVAPRALWSEAVTLFRFVEEKGLQQNLIQTIDRDSVSLQQVFASLALLQLSDPYQLQPDTAWQLRRYLDRHSKKAPLFDSSSTAFKDKTNLVIDSQADIKKHVLLINLTKLIKQINHDLDLLALPKKPKIAGFAKETNIHAISHALKSVLATWERLGKRRTSYLSPVTERSHRDSERVAVHQPLELATGINTTWYALNKQRPFNPKLFDAHCSNEIDLGALSDDNTSIQKTDYKIATGSTINRSKGGVALHVELLEGMQLHVGQLVALHRPSAHSNHASWIISVCRWLIKCGSNNVNIGLQYLANDARPIALRSRLGDSTTSGILPAFIVTQQQQTILITPAGIFRPDALLDIYDQGNKISVRCKTLMEACSGFERFVYKVT